MKSGKTIMRAALLDTQANERHGTDKSSFKFVKHSEHVLLHISKAGMCQETNSHSSL